MRNLLFILLFITAGQAYGQTTDFMFTVKTDNAGSSSSTSFTLPTNSLVTTYSYNVNWGDGSNADAGLTGSITHNFTTAGTYQVRVSGTFPSIAFSNSLDDKLKLLSIDQWGTMNWASFANGFYGCANLVIKASDIPDLTVVTDLSDMFYNCSSITTITKDALTQWDVSHVALMQHMFDNCTNFNQDISKWNTAAVTDMFGMFTNCPNFNKDISKWNTAAVTDMSSMFYNCTNFNQDISSWNTAAVTNMEAMFGQCTNFNQSISGWNTAAVTNMSNMFASCKNYNQDVSNWNTAAVTDMSWMFNGCPNFNKDLSNWNTAAVTNMFRMFTGCTHFNQNISNWHTAAVTNMSTMFNGCTIFNQDISKWNTAAVTKMDHMFSSCLNFTSDLSSWNTAKVTDMTYMFYNCTNFNSVVSGWNTAAVTSMYGMFNSCSSFNTDVSGWNTAAVTNMSQMFGSCTIFNQNIGSWITSAVTDMSSMFQNCSNFNQDISGWNMAAVTDMSDMFENCTSYNQKVSGWNTAAVTGMSSMFQGCTNFDQEISGWNTAAVTDMSFMFQGCTNFNSLISNFNTAAVITMSQMFNSCNIFNQDISSWNTAAVTDMSQMFLYCTNFNQDISSWNTSAVTTMNSMFYTCTNFNENLGAWNIGKTTDMSFMLSNSGMSADNYEATLGGWLKTAPAGIYLGADALTYCSSLYRDSLTSPLGKFNWTISGDTYLYGATVPALVADGSYTETSAGTCIDTSGSLLFVDNLLTPTSKYITINPNGNTGYNFSVIAANNSPVINNHMQTDGSSNTTALSNRMYTVTDAGTDSYTTNGGMTVRIYYSADDSTNATNMLDPKVTGPITSQWFKYSGTSHFNNVDSILKNQTYNNITNATFLVPSARGIENGVAYVEFSGITSFSTFGFVAAKTTFALPITLTSFTANANGCSVNLAWKVATEQNSSYYAVEASTNGADFTQVAKVDSKNSATGAGYQYSYLPNSATTYFRLRAVDISGKFTYSAIASATVNCNGIGGVSISPNPAVDMVNIQGIVTGSNIMLYDLHGKKLMETKATSTNQTISIGSYAKGLYLLNIQAANGSVSTTKIIKL